MKGFLKRIVAILFMPLLGVLWFTVNILGMFLTLIVMGISWLLLGPKGVDKAERIFDWFLPMAELTPKKAWDWWLSETETEREE